MGEYADAAIERMIYGHMRIGNPRHYSKRYKAGAKSNLAKVRVSAHTAFDDMWKDGDMSRGQAYHWLAAKMDMPVSDCHMGMMNEKQCNQVLQICVAQGFPDLDD